MPTIILATWAGKLDGSVKARVMTFLQKLSADDTTPGLHVEPIQQSADPRVRTGRVDQSYRAVMFRLDGEGETHYVIHGVWPHDDAITVARSVRLRVNPVNGLPQIDKTPAPEEPSTAAPAAAPSTSGTGHTPQLPTSQEPSPTLPGPAETPLLTRLGVSRSDLVERLGVPDDVADAVTAAPDEDAVIAVAQQHEGWLGLMLLDLATGDSVETIAEKMQLEPDPSAGNADSDVLRSLQRPAARAQFSFIEDQDELRRVIDSGDFGAWRVFLHPAQRRYVDRSYSGPFRLSGGAGTGKTVVLMHRARALARRSPDARIVLTTFTTNLADSLRKHLGELDPRVPVSKTLGRPGVHVTGVDALAAAVIRTAGPGVDDAVRAVLGEARSAVSRRVPGARWRAVLDSTTTSLPAQVANETFLAAEYATVVLPHRVRTEDEYLRVRRPGRGTALDRSKRRAVWALVSAYRRQNRVDGSLDYAEAAAVAAAYLEGLGGGPRPMADHVLVDEGQDLTPAHWQLLRALVVEGSDDLFIAEDSHQRIYGQRIVLGRYGIRIVGRSQRLTLNYRTTAQNLRYATSILDGSRYVDLEDAEESTGYRSARSGPEPDVVAASGVGEELDRIAERVSSWLAEEEVAPETVAVLVSDRYQRDRVVAGLAERGVEARAVDREQPPEGRTLVMTMHRAKGMEFSRVAIVSPSRSSRRLLELDDAERADAQLRERSLMYVAATRARDKLMVVQPR